VLTTGTDANEDVSPDTMELHRMFTTWDANATWNSLSDGVSIDDVEADREPDFLAQPNSTGAPTIWTTTQTVQSWVDGEPNHGWVITADGSDGWGWSSSDAALIHVRPRLEVIYFTPSVAPGDFNQDGLVDVNDIDALSVAVRNETNDSTFDLNRDGSVNNEDRAIWVQQIKHTWFGDADLDGQFTTADLVRVFQSNEYEDGKLNNSTWADGDWNGDGEFASSDFVVAFQDGGYERDIRPKWGVAVPGPSCRMLLSIASATLLIVTRGVRFQHITSEDRFHQVSTIDATRFWSRA
jgi:hypothetical protein